MSTFLDIGVSPLIAKKLSDRNIFEPTAVQKCVIPKIISKKNVLFQSETGTGKTFAYLLPVLDSLIKEYIETGCKKEAAPEIFIVAPTNELASQIKHQIDLFMYPLTDDNKPSKETFTINSVLLIGGTAISRQIERLKDKPQFIVGGASRIVELIKLKKLKTNAASVIIFDEVDRLLSKELRDSAFEFLSLIKNKTQFIACSATLKKNITLLLSDKIGEFETEILPMEDILRKKIEHWAFFAENRDKIDTLRRIINAVHPKKMIVFSSKLDQIDNIVQKLQYKKIDCIGLHAKTDKIQRKKAIDSFKNGKIPVLVTSDLASRGLDFEDIEYIIQMDMTKNEDFFIHRAGRTGRAGKNGINIVIGDEWEMRQLALLEKKLKIIIYPKMIYNGKIEKPSEML